MVINFYDTIKKNSHSINPNKDKHGIDIPFRMCIASGSGTGKSHALCRLIYEFGKSFHEIIICVPSADEPLYNMLDSRLNTNKHKGVIFFEDSKIPPLTDYATMENGKMKRKDKLQRLIVFDDYMCNPAANRQIKEYYLRGRKCEFSSIYISQNYYQIPRDVRVNTQLFMLGKNIQKRDIRNILSLFSIDLDLDKFTEIYNLMTDKPLDTILIDQIAKTIAHNIIEHKYHFNNSRNCILSYNQIITDFTNECNGISTDNQ